MFKIGIDTSTWRHWFDWQDGVLTDSPRSKPDKPTPFENAEAFERIYQHISAHSSRYIVLYTETVKMELKGKQYRERFAAIQTQSWMWDITEGMQRWDGARHYGDGLPFGYVPFYDKHQIYDDKDSLRVVLNLSGHNHEEALKKAQPDNRTPNPLHTKERRKEFDPIILEGCLGVADIFLTDDTKFVGRVKSASREHPNNLAVKEALRITCYPANAFGRIQAGSGRGGAAGEAEAVISQ